MNEWITPDQLKEHHDNGYSAGVAHERKRIIKLLEQTKSPSHVWGGIAWAIALIKGENK